MRSTGSIGRVFIYILTIIAGASLAIFQVHMQSLRTVARPIRPATAYIVPVIEETVVFKEMCSIEETDETSLIARVVQAEAGNQAFVGKIAVAMTILNRMDYYGQTAEEVIYADNQYATPASIWTEEDERAVEFARQNRDLFPENLIFFRTDHYHSFGEPYTVIGDHYFSVVEEEDG